MGGVRAGLQAEVGQDSRDAFVEVCRAGGHPAVKSQGVGVVSAGAAGAERLGSGLHLRRCLGAAGAAGDVAGHGLAGHALVFLGQPAHEGVGRGEAHAAVLGLVHAGQQAQQGGFAGAVGADHAHHVAGGHREGELGEKRPVVVAAGQVFGNKGCSHGLVHPLAAGRRKAG